MCVCVCGLVGFVFYCCSTTIAENLLLVDEIMKAGMSVGVCVCVCVSVSDHVAWRNGH